MIWSTEPFATAGKILTVCEHGAETSEGLTLPSSLLRLDTHLLAQLTFGPVHTWY